MNQSLLRGVLALCFALTPIARAADTNSASVANPKFTYVIVHGAWGGGWAFKEVERLLRADGHTVYRPTLTGQGEKNHLAGLLTTNIDLNLHITDVVNAIEWEKLQDVVLVGHSYGGMVVTGVADRVPDRIKRLIYLDAIVPEHGESANQALGNLGRDTTNAFIAPFWLKGNEPVPHDVPHPARTFSQPITLKNQDAARKIPTTYILTVDPGQEPQRDTFFKCSERAKARGWPVLVMEADHNPQWSKPQELVELLEKAVK
jgi:pimeloyl-ACP methyl ester carboxylesterase